MKKINLACGNTFISGDEWLNFDYVSSSPAVRKANLLDRLPLEENSVSLVYSSHFLEHIPYSDVPNFLAECYRILQPGGVLRLVLPDFENLCRAYLECREQGEHKEANFIILEIVDQCVRRDSGGELGRFYQVLRGSPTDEDSMIEFVKQRTGEDILASGTEMHSLSKIGVKTLVRKVQNRVERMWIRLVINLLPRSFRAQNVSLASVGELHHWLWDYDQLGSVLRSVGFTSIERRNAQTSSFPDFPYSPLDVNAYGQPRKGSESMYIEAIKPLAEKVA
jgi:SAM-dependent methyltransferase